MTEAQLTNSVVHTLLPRGQSSVWESSVKCLLRKKRGSIPRRGRQTWSVTAFCVFAALSLNTFEKTGKVCPWLFSIAYYQWPRHSYINFARAGFSFGKFTKNVADRDQSFNKLVYSYLLQQLLNPVEYRLCTTAGTKELGQPTNTPARLGHSLSQPVFTKGDGCFQIKNSFG